MALVILFKVVARALFGNRLERPGIIWVLILAMIVSGLLTPRSDIFYAIAIILGLCALGIQEFAPPNR